MRWAGIGLFSTLRILATVRYVRFTSERVVCRAQKAVVADGAADRSNRPEPTIRPELQTCSFFTHIDTGDWSLGGDLRLGTSERATQRDASHCSS